MSKPNGKMPPANGSIIPEEEKKALTLARVTKIPQPKNPKAELSTDRDLWERQHMETAKAFAGFVAYRDIGPERRVTTAGIAIGKSEPVMRRWAERWHWTHRARAWDNHLDAIRRAEFLHRPVCRRFHKV